MFLQNLLSFDFVTFAKDIFAFLKTHTGSDIIAFATMGIVGLLIIALLVCTFVAICKPSKRKFRKLDKTLKKQSEYDNARNRIFELAEKISATKLEIRILNKQLEDKVFNLTEVERSSYEQDDLFIMNKKNQIYDLKETQAILVSVLKQKQRGFRSPAQKEKIECAKLLIAELSAQEDAYQREIYLKNAEIENRKKKLNSELALAKYSCTTKVKQLNDNLDSYEREKSHLAKKLAKLNNKGGHKLSFADAKAMIDDYARQKKLKEKQLEESTLEDLKRAKASYESAKNHRILAEKNKNLAVENVKALQKERAKAKNKKLIKYTPITEASFTSGEKPEDVNIIIADINSNAILAPINTEEAITEKNVEQIYSEPTVKVVDFDDIPKDDVIFVEAFLDYLNENSEDLSEESAATEDEDQINDEILQPVADLDTVTDEITTEENIEENALSNEVLDVDQDINLSQTSDILDEAQENDPIDSVKQEIDTIDNVRQEIDTIDSAKPEIDQTPVEDVEIEVTTSVFTPEISASDEISMQEVLTAKKYPAYKDYNDGIPATPIYKTSKFQKPVTKLVKKIKTTRETTQNVEEENSSLDKTGYKGKWKIKYNEGKYSATLTASNGGELLTTPSYTSVNAVRKCIETIKDCLENDSVEITLVKDGKYCFKILSSSKRTILHSAKYSTKYQCQKALASAKRFSQTALNV